MSLRAEVGRTQACYERTDWQLLSPHALEEPGAHDDAPTMLALETLGEAVTGIGGICFAQKELRQASMAGESATS